MKFYDFRIKLKGKNISTLKNKVDPISTYQKNVSLSTFIFIYVKFCWYVNFSNMTLDNLLLDVLNNVITFG